MYARVMRKWSLKSKLMSLLWLTLVTMLLIVIAAPITATTAASRTPAANQTIVRITHAARARDSRTPQPPPPPPLVAASARARAPAPHTNAGDMLRMPYSPLPQPAAPRTPSSQAAAATSSSPPDNVAASVESQASKGAAAAAAARSDAGAVEESSYYIPVTDDAADDVRTRPETGTATGTGTGSGAGAEAVAANVVSNIYANRLIYKLSSACNTSSSTGSSSAAASHSGSGSSGDNISSTSTSSRSSSSSSSSSSSRLFSNTNRLSSTEQQPQQQLEALPAAGVEAAAIYADRLMYAAHYDKTTTVFDEDDANAPANNDDDDEDDDAVEEYVAEEPLAIGGTGGVALAEQLYEVVADDGDGNGNGNVNDDDADDDDDVGEDDDVDDEANNEADVEADEGMGVGVGAGKDVAAIPAATEEGGAAAAAAAAAAASKQKVPNVKDSHVINLFNDNYNNYNNHNDNPNHNNRRTKKEQREPQSQPQPVAESAASAVVERSEAMLRRLAEQQQSLTLPPAAVAVSASASASARSTKMRRHIQQEQLQLQRRHYAAAATATAPGAPQNYFYNSPVRETVAMRRGGGQEEDASYRYSSSSSSSSGSGSVAALNSNAPAPAVVATAPQAVAPPLPLRYIIEAFEISPATERSAPAEEQQRRMLLHQQELRHLRKLELQAARSRRESRAYGQIRQHSATGNGGGGGMGGMGGMGSIGGIGSLYQQHHFNGQPHQQSQLQQPYLQQQSALHRNGDDNNKMLDQQPHHHHPHNHRKHRLRQRQWHRQHEGRPARRYCSARDPAQLAFEAPTVVEGKIISMSPDRRANFSVSVEVQQIFKMQIGFERPKYMRLQFAYRNTSGECDIYREQLRVCGLVHGDELEAKRVYLMFLQQIGLSNFTILGQPIRKTKRVVQAVRKAVSVNYAQLATIRSLTANNRTVVNGRELRIVCKVQGQPPPKVTWFKDHKSINRNRKLYQFIHYKKRSELVIRSFNSSDAGRYECRAKNKVNHNVERRTIVIKAYPAPRYDPPTGGTGNKCPDDASEFCFNGGTCKFFSEIGSYSCICPEGFIGERCDRKEVNNMPPSTYSNEQECGEKKFLGSYYC